MNNFRGFPLFNDVPDLALKSHNRAAIMTNIAEDHQTSDKKINVKGASLLIGYFQSIPETERKALAASFAKTMTERGFAIAA
jgi:hypothetical protein